MSNLVNKLDALQALISEVKGSLSRAKIACKNSQNDANEAPGAMISRYDSAKEESQYLAGAQQQRVSIIERGLSSLILLQREIAKLPPANKAVCGAILIVESNGKEICIFLAPYGGGTVLKTNGIDILVVTKESPLGGALWGLEEGDNATVKKGRDVQDFEILTIL